MRTDYSRDWGLAKWGSGVSLHGSNPEPLMTALGQKRTSERNGKPSRNESHSPLSARHVN
jgi:hypothetical protein